MPILAAFSHHDDALDWAQNRATDFWGPVALASPRFEFTETDYYEPTMGPGLRKCFWAFERLADPQELVEWKLQANRWEEEFAELHCASAGEKGTVPFCSEDSAKGDSPRPSRGGQAPFAPSAAADKKEPVPESRPLNLDPGYLTAAKLVLASTKDHSHRLYLAEGIYAEVTLYYRDGRWQPREWTFPDYRRADYQEFFNAARRLLRQAVGRLS